MTLTITHAHSLYSGSGSVDFSPNRNYIATGDADGDVGFWEVGNDGVIKYIDLGGDVQGVDFSPDGRYLAADGNDGNVIVRLLDVATRTTVRSRYVHDDARNINSIAYSPGGKYVAVGIDLTWAYIWNLISGEMKGWGKTDASEVYDVAFSPDGRYLATGNDNGDLTLWELNSWWTDNANKIDFKPGGNVQAVAFSLDGKYLAADGYDGSNTYVNIYNMDTNRVAWQITSGDVRAITFSPNGEYIALGDDEATITFYKIGANPTHVGEITASGEVLDLAWSPDGIMISDGRDVWNVTQQTPDPHDNTDTNQDPDVTVSLSPSAVQSPAIGEQLTVSINITDGENVSGYQATVNFDTTALKYVQSANGDYLPAGAFFIPPKTEGGTVTLAVTSLAGESNGDGTLATITFEVVAVKDSTLTLSNVLLTNSAGQSSEPLVEATQITESAPLSNGIGLTLPADLISEVAYAPNSTYFVLNAQYPTLTGVDNADVSYGNCTITLDLEGVPDNSLSDRLLPTLLEYISQVRTGSPILNMAKDFAEQAGLLDVFPDEPQYFIFPLQTAVERSRDVETESALDYFVTATTTLVGLLGFKGTLISLGIKVGSIEYNRILEINEILKSTMDPVIVLDTWGFLQDLVPQWQNPGRPNDKDKYVLIFPKRVTEIGIKIEQVYILKSDQRNFHTATYDGTYNLETNVFSAPSKQLMTLSDYPPFQLPAAASAGLSPKLLFRTYE